MYFSKNIKNINLEIYEKLKSTPIEEKFVIEKCRKDNRYITAKVDTGGVEIYLHSVYNPMVEAVSFVNNNFENKNILLYGFGLGYVVEEYLKRMEPDKKLMVIISNPAVFKEAVRVIDLSLILSNPQLNLLFYRDSFEFNNDIKKILANYDDNNLKVVVHQPSLKTTPEKFREITDIFEKIEIQKKSHRSFKKEISDNIRKNIDLILVSGGIGQLKDRFKGKPVFVIAAGPSLAKNIKRLKDVCTKGIIISVGTAYSSLRKEGIKPDFMIIMDSQDSMHEQIKEFITDNTPLIFFPSTNNKALKNYTGEKIAAYPTEDESFKKMNEIEEKGFLESGGSVANVAVSAAVHMGAAKIIFVGQDLAYGEDGSTHSSGTIQEDRKMTAKYLKKIPGYYGGTVKTGNNLYIYLRWFENFIRENRITVEFINSTEGGAKIGGTIQMPLKEAIEKYCTEEFDKTIKIVKPANSDFLKKRAAIIKILKDTGVI